MSKGGLTFVVSEPLKGSRQIRNPLGEMLLASATRLIELQVSALTDELSARIGAINDVLAGIDTSGGPYDIDTVSVSFTITNEGKVAILSTVEGTTAPQVGLQFTLTRRRPGNVRSRK